MHLGPPCTFWSPMAHFTRRQTADQNEEKRLQELTHLVFAQQILTWQIRHGRHASFENPPRCRSWDFDIVRNMLALGSMSIVEFHLCCFGAVDPGNGLPYKKAMRIATSCDLAPLQRKCDGGHQHQTIEGSVQCGQLKGVRRTTISGEYTFQLCNAWVLLMRAAECGPQA